MASCKSFSLSGDGSSRRLLSSRQISCISARRCVALSIATVATLLAIAGTPASAWTGYIDGISDQSLPYWDGGFSGSYFHGFFKEGWVGSPPSHIKYARYVVQWNVMSPGYEAKRSEFESWLTDIEGMGLIPDVVPTSYNGSFPSSTGEYESWLNVLLSRATAMHYPVSYVEPWNEPNAQGKEGASVAASYANVANGLCKKTYGCTVVAGNMEDLANVAEYVKEYRASLNFSPVIWGVHPYRSVANENDANLLSFKKALPREGVGDRIWFTEIAVRQCTDYKGVLKNRGEIWQATNARWLVRTLLVSFKPEHAFYYEFLYKGRERPPCNERETDGALYLPSSDPNAPDSPRPAAAVIYDDVGFPLGYTGAASSVATPNATLTASVYPGGLLDAKYHFEYGAATSYGSYSSEGDAGSGAGMTGASKSVGGIAPETTYHYRIVVWNSEGTDYGSDKTFADGGDSEIGTWLWNLSNWSDAGSWVVR
jgi:hypothetical protein